MFSIGVPMILTDIRLAMLNVLGSYTTSAWHNETKVLPKHSLRASSNDQYDIIQLLKVKQSMAPSHLFHHQPEVGMNPWNMSVNVWNSKRKG